MIFRSNLTAPDLQPMFKHVVSRPMPHSYGHDVLSDWADKIDDDPVYGIFKRCGFWTVDEAAILYTIAKQVGGAWLDIGSHTGWTTAHISETGCSPVLAVDYMYDLPEFAERAMDNYYRTGIHRLAFKSDAYFKKHVKAGGYPFNGVVIDGDHIAPQPLHDAQNSHQHLADNGVILFHDAIGKPVQDAVLWLVQQGYKCKVYSTPHVVACCWRGDFVPPEHVPDPRVKACVREYLGGLAEYAC